MNNLSASTPKIYSDKQMRHLYANDASMYEELPQGVAFPKNVSDIQALVKNAGQKGFTLTPRSAGTSLAGQTTGSGIIMDVSRHMNRLIDLDPHHKTAHIQPGVIRDTLNRRAAENNLVFGPDTATTSRCMLGGMIGNNSCGLFSIKHKTTREHILAIEAVLSDGSTAIFKPLSPDELEQKKELNSLEGQIYRGVLKLIERNRDQILAAYPHPEIIRRNTGYALDRLCEMQPFNPDGRPFNMAELLCGSEGTLAVTASASVKLVPKSPERVVLVPHFESVHAAMQATVEAVTHDPAAVELIDDTILNATKDNIEQRKNRFFLQSEPKCILIIQFEGDSHDQVKENAKKLKNILSEKQLSSAAPVIKDEEKIKRVWNLRKAGLGLLMGLGSDEKSPSFCEDTAVRVKDLPDYVNDFQQLLKQHNTHCVFYGHASVGELHLRPVLDIQQPDGRTKMKKMAGEVAKLVKKYNGSLSGEHGDGRVRAPHIKQVLGSEMMPLLKKIKETWDPNYLFNPGKIVQPKPMDEELRIAVSSSQDEALETNFKWRKEGSFEEALDLCNGAGVCRKMAESGGTMCPSYMATKEEKDSTRGRANLFRQLFAGKNSDAFTSDELYDALDLCISCKGCKSECPANVDMARMKAEFMQGWHDQKGVPLSTRFFAQAGTLYPVASYLSELTNWIVNTNVGKELLYRWFNISRERTLPRFARETFMQWHRRRPAKSNTARPQVVLLIDIFTNYHDPEIGKAAVRVLEAIGFEVVVPDFMELGRPQLSKGMVKKAKEIVHQNIPVLSAYAEQEIPIIGLEPSEILTLRDEYLDLCDDQWLSKAEAVAANSFQFEEFMVKALSDHPKKETLFNNHGKQVYLHGHCHSKALTGNTATLKTLELAGYQTTEMNTGCCGMAGSFGYEADHYDTSMDIGKLALFPSIEKIAEDALICVPGFSCRHQVKHGTNRKSFHPSQLLADQLKNAVNP